MLDRHGIGVGVEIRQCLKLGDPTTVYLVRNDQLARFVVELNNDVLAKILEGHLGAEARAKLPDLVRPFFEFCIVSYGTFERDCFIFGDAWRLAACARVAALAMLNNFGGAFERADPRNSGHVSAVPFHSEFEIFVGVDALRIDSELRHMPASDFE